MEQDYKIYKKWKIVYQTVLNDIIKNRINTQEIIEVLNRNKCSKRVFYYEDYMFSGNDTYSDMIEELHQQCFELAERVGGGEGEGEYFCEVVHIKPLNTYIEHTGTYYSYNGIDYLTDYYQVYPKQVLKTIYVTEK